MVLNSSSRVGAGAISSMIRIRSGGGRTIGLGLWLDSRSWSKWKRMKRIHTTINKLASCHDGIERGQCQLSSSTWHGIVDLRSWHRKTCLFVLLKILSLYQNPHTSSRLNDSHALHFAATTYFWYETHIRLLFTERQQAILEILRILFKCFGRRVMLPSTWLNPTLISRATGNDTHKGILRIRVYTHYFTHSDIQYKIDDFHAWVMRLCEWILISEHKSHTLLTSTWRFAWRQLRSRAIWLDCSSVAVGNPDWAFDVNLSMSLSSGLVDYCLVQEVMWCNVM